MKLLEGSGGVGVIRDSEIIRLFEVFGLSLGLVVPMPTLPFIVVKTSSLGTL